MKEGYLICNLATAPLMAQGSAFDRHCSRCGVRVMIAPSGQKILREKQLEIVCMPCILPDLEKRDEFTLVRPTGEQVLEAKRPVLNLWRKRN